MKLEYSIQEMREAAASLFENGSGALRAGETERGKILLGIAEKLWLEVEDFGNAQKARNLQLGLPMNAIGLPRHIHHD